MRKSIFYRVIIMLVLYLGLSYFGQDIGRKLLYPIRMLVTFLHEFGHAIGAVITGGSVLDVQINPDGSGFTRSRGGAQTIILMGGYLGSAIFGNILFLIAARAKKLVNPVLLLLAASMLITGLFWYNSIFTTTMLVLFAAVIIWIALKTNFGKEVLMFLGLASILFIIQDFNVGPSSDLKAYAEIMRILPANVWMYLWLVIALLLFAINLRIIFKSEKEE